MPIKGHYGSKKGTPKYVHVYKTTSSSWRPRASRPANGGALARQGWIKVGKVRTDGLGKYRKGSDPPRHGRPGTASGTRGDAWYWGAWTSVAKVTVR